MHDSDGREPEHDTHGHDAGVRGSQEPALAATRAPLMERELWRSLEDRGRTPAARVRVQAEILAPLAEPTSRRSFLQLMGASMALAGLGACARQPIEKIVPYVKQPEDLVPGRPLFFATALTIAGVASPVLVESHEGRPTKIEGNPEHPASLGATDRFAQADIMRLYDPDRSTVVMHLDDISTWANCTEALRVALGEQLAKRGAGLRILTPSVTSPALAAQIGAVLAQYPDAKWVQYDPDGRDAVREASRRAFGAPMSVRYDLSNADVVVTLDSDLLTSGPGNVRYARDFMRRRRIHEGESATMNRLYAVESMPTSTGSVADHRVGLAPSEIALFTAALAAELGVAGATRPSAALPDKAARWVVAVAKELAAHRGRSLVVAGDCLPVEVQVLAFAINAALGNVGPTFVVTDPIEVRPTAQHEELAALASDMQSGRVETLLVLESNPVYDAPVDLAFGDAMRRVPNCFHLGLYRDETAELCQWHVPAVHELESWGDARAYDGTLSLQQPLVEPLYDGHSSLDVLMLVAGQTGTVLDLIRSQWQVLYGGAGFEKLWRRTLHDGFASGSQFVPRGVELRADAVRDAATRLAGTSASGNEVVLRFDPNVHDGRFANNGWLQEVPKPWTKLVWDNAAIVSAAMAHELGVETGDMVELQTDGGKVEAGVWVLPGHAERCVTAHLGYGRRRGGNVAAGAGFDAYALSTTRSRWGGPVQVRKVAGHRTLVTTQEHHDMMRRNLVRRATLEEFTANPHFAHEEGPAPARDESMFKTFEYKGNAWGVAIDLGSCTGCNACVVACNSENNIAVVGRDQVRRNREMHWIRIDRYFEGDLNDPQIHHQPVMCMQCENAPCEQVCPVAATSHSPEGLNDMVYNRCVGTRYCSNNCPYKVRRFNFYGYQDVKTPVLQLMRNPDVTIRTRGVMEKCTYCVQRINHARIDAKNENRPIRDGEIVTACQQVCPTEAIVFGDINDPESKVAKMKRETRNYGVLEDLNTRPRTTYVAKLRNPNSELEAKA